MTPTLTLPSRTRAWLVRLLTQVEERALYVADLAGQALEFLGEASNEDVIPEEALEKVFDETGLRVFDPTEPEVDDLSDISLYDGSEGVSLAWVLRQYTKVGLYDVTAASIIREGKSTGKLHVDTTTCVGPVTDRATYDWAQATIRRSDRTLALAGFRDGVLHPFVT